jgi:transcription elongation factor B subunit 1
MSRPPALSSLPSSVSSGVPLDDLPSPHPLSEYVKLISCDGDEFFVNRSVALCSGTIRAMLTGPGRWAENSGPIPTIQFENINTPILERICQYFYYRARFDRSAPPLPAFPIDTQSIVKLLLAADFLDT